MTFPRVGAALIASDYRERIVLGKRAKDPLRDCWILPGGKIGPFESMADAALREFKEETGLDAIIGRQFRAYDIVDPPNEHRIVVYYWASIASERSIRPGGDVSEVRLVHTNEMYTENLRLTPLVRLVIAEATGSAFLLERGAS